MTLRTLNYGNYGIFLIMGNAGFCPSAVVKAPAIEAGASHQGPVGNYPAQWQIYLGRETQGRVFGWDLGPFCCWCGFGFRDF